MHQKHQCCDSEVFSPENNLNTESSSEKHDTTGQNKRDVHNIRLLSSKDETDWSSFKRRLCTCSPKDETLTVRIGKRQRKSDFRLPNDQKEPDISSSEEERWNSQCNCGANERKPQVLLSFEPEHMKEKRFLYDAPDTLDGRSNKKIFTTKIFDLPFEVHTSWEGCAVQKIENIPDQSTDVLDLSNSAAIRTSSFFHYVKIIAFLVRFWQKQEKQDIIFLVGRFSVRLQASNLYCCPIKKDDEELHLQDKKLSYATLSPSEKFAKKYSETIWNYMVGNHDKVNKYVQTPQDAIAVCAVLFSEVIRYPNMLFHNILMMLYYKSWNEFCDYHPMVRGGSWKHQNNDVPEKVKKIEKDNLLFFAKEMMRDGMNNGVLFQLSVSMQIKM